MFARKATCIYMAPGEQSSFSMCYSPKVVKDLPRQDKEQVSTTRWDRSVLDSARARRSGPFNHRAAPSRKGISQSSCETAKTYPRLLSTAVPLFTCWSKQMSLEDIEGRAASSCSLLCTHTRSAWIPDPHTPPTAANWSTTQKMLCTVLPRLLFLY